MGKGKNSLPEADWQPFLRPVTNNCITGADNYEKYLPILKDKKIGMVTNQTGILSNKTHLVDFLLEKMNFESSPSDIVPPGIRV